MGATEVLGGVVTQAVEDFRGPHEVGEEKDDNSREGTHFRSLPLSVTRAVDTATAVVTRSLYEGSAGPPPVFCSHVPPRDATVRISHSRSGPVQIPVDYGSGAPDVSVGEGSVVASVEIVGG